MATANAVPSFDDIIQAGKNLSTLLPRQQLSSADRLRRKNEALANEIFGKRRRASTPTPGGKRKPGTGPSLASRVGVTKVCPQHSGQTDPILSPLAYICLSHLSGQLHPHRKQEQTLRRNGFMISMTTTIAGSLGLSMSLKASEFPQTTILLCQPPNEE